MASPLQTPHGPFRADQIRPGDPYELSHGHPIYCAPTGGRGAGPNGLGYAVLRSDPAVTEAGVDAGFSPEPDMLRAPDIAVGNVPPKPGWIRGVPPLAVEYADTGQNEEQLQEKIADLLRHGTKHVWVVRLTGPRRVEVYEPNASMRVAEPQDLLEAPGILQNPVRVVELYDPEAALEATLRNLLQRHGYESLEAIREAHAEAEARAEEAEARAEREAKARAEEAKARAEEAKAREEAEARAEREAKARAEEAKAREDDERFVGAWDASGSRGATGETRR